MFRPTSAVEEDLWLLLVIVGVTDRFWLESVLPWHPRRGLACCVMVTEVRLSARQTGHLLWSWHSYRTAVQILHSWHSYRTAVQIVHSWHSYLTAVQIVHSWHSYLTAVQILHSRNDIVRIMICLSTGWSVVSLFPAVNKVRLLVPVYVCVPEFSLCVRACACVCFSLCVFLVLLWLCVLCDSLPVCFVCFCVLFCVLLWLCVFVFALCLPVCALYASPTRSLWTNWQRNVMSGFILL